MPERESDAFPLETREPSVAQAPAASRLSLARLTGLCACVLVLTGLIEWGMGRLLLGPDGRFGVWEGNIYSQECSQRLADAYSFSHVVHGICFYFGLWLVAKSSPWRRRFLLAVLAEAVWEVLENSPMIIDRYRQTATALGYNGDSILNSISDILMMILGFLLARRARVWQTILLLVLMELGCAWWIRDNLTLNVINLIHPVPAIERWQSAGRPRELVSPTPPANRPDPSGH